MQTGRTLLPRYHIIAARPFGSALDKKASLEETVGENIVVPWVQRGGRLKKEVEIDTWGYHQLLERTYICRGAAPGWWRGPGDGGAAHIELRQSSMGEYEEGAGEDWRPATDKLGRLARTFPAVSFNLAIACPCLTEGLAPSSPFFQASLEAARVLGGASSPMLRMVDLARFDSPWETEGDVSPAAASVAALADEAARHEVRLFLENSGQPIRSMELLVTEARKAMTVESVPYLGLCVDSINSMRADPGSDPVAEIETLPRDHISMVHFKQTRDGQPQPTLGEGDLDYPRLLKVLETKGYDGLAVLELPATEEVFDHFRESVDYLKALMGAG